MNNVQLRSGNPGKVGFTNIKQKRALTVARLLYGVSPGIHTQWGGSIKSASVSSQVMPPRSAMVNGLYEVDEKGLPSRSARHRDALPSQIAIAVRVIGVKGADSIINWPFLTFLVILSQLIRGARWWNYRVIMTSGVRFWLTHTPSFSSPRYRSSYPYRRLFADSSLSAYPGD